MLVSPHADAAVVLELEGRVSGNNNGTAGSSPKDTFFEPIEAENTGDDVGDEANAPSAAAAATLFYTPSPLAARWPRGTASLLRARTRRAAS